MFGVTFYFFIHLLTQNYEINVATHVERKGLVFRDQPAVSPQRVRSQRSPILGVPFYLYPYTFCRRTTKFDVVTHVGEGRVSRVSYASHPKRVEFQGSPVLGFSCIYANYAYTL